MSARRIVLGLLATASLSIGSARADMLGPAQGYNVFILGNDASSIVESDGRMAVGGNADLSLSNIANTLPLNTPDAFVVNGNLTFSAGKVNGDLHVGGNMTTTAFAVSGSTIHDKPIDFGAAGSSLTSLSTFLASQSANGSVVTGPSGLTLTGTNANLNVFNLTATQLQAANDKTLNINIPNGSTVLINVSGSSVGLEGITTKINGSTSELNPEIGKVLFNFAQASSLSDTTSPLLGSVLAPGAALDFKSLNLFDGVHVDGTLVGASLTGHLDARNVTFSGNLPAVPEPTSLGLLAIGGLGAGLVLRRRRA